MTQSQYPQAGDGEAPNKVPHTIDLGTDILVAEACSMIENLIRKHHAIVSHAIQSEVPAVVVRDAEPAARIPVRPQYQSDETQESFCDVAPVIMQHPSEAPTIPYVSQSSPLGRGFSSGSLSPFGNPAMEGLANIHVEDEEKKNHVMNKGQLHTISVQRNPSFFADHAWRLRETMERIVTSPSYARAIFVIILSNAVYLGIDVEDSASGSASQESISKTVINLAYSGFFFIELVVRLVTLQCKFFTAADARWNWFDLIIVCLTTAQAVLHQLLEGSQIKQLSIMNMLRSMRILRIINVVRGSRSLRPLRCLLVGIIGTMQGACWAFGLLFSVIYFFSLTFTAAASAHQYKDGIWRHDPAIDYYFGSLGRSSGTLFQSICGGADWQHPLSTLGRIDMGGVYQGIFYVYILIAYFIVLNVVTAYFCQNAIENSLADHDLFMEAEFAKHKGMRARLEAVFERLDRQEGPGVADGKLTLDELQTVLGLAEVRAEFAMLEIKPQDAWNMFKLLDESGDGVLDKEEFISGCLNLQGDSTKMDISLLMYDINSTSSQLDMGLKQVLRTLEKMDSKSQSSLRMHDSRSYTSHGSYTSVSSGNLCVL
jgi:Ca2+-binding EF-hand superfamily protein